MMRPLTHRMETALLVMWDGQEQAPCGLVSAYTGLCRRGLAVYEPGEPWTQEAVNAGTWTHGCHVLTPTGRHYAARADAARRRRLAHLSKRRAELARGDGA